MTYIYIYIYGAYPGAYPGSTPDLKKPHSRPPQVPRPQKTAFSTATGSWTSKNRILDRHRFPDFKKPHSRPLQVPGPGPQNFKKNIFFQIVPGPSREVRTTLGTIPSGIPSSPDAQNDPKSTSQKKNFFFKIRLRTSGYVC